jgi:hypothetical protein
MKIRIRNWLITNRAIGIVPEDLSHELIKPGSVLDVPDDIGRSWILAGIGMRSKDETTPWHIALWNRTMGFLGW